MTRQIFISSVQKELQDFRDAVYDYVTSDPLLKQFFTVFQFEKLPAADRAADNVYLDEVAKTDIYLGLFANEYGWEDGRRHVKWFNTLTLNDRQHEVFFHVLDHGRITNSEVQKLTGATRKTASRDLDELVELNLLERKGKGRGTHYVEAK